MHCTSPWKTMTHASIMWILLLNGPPRLLKLQKLKQYKLLDPEGLQGPTPNAPKTETKQEKLLELDPVVGQGGDGLKQYSPMIKAFRYLFTTVHWIGYIRILARVCF